jgi:pyocin large subunit-like protein
MEGYFATEEQQKAKNWDMLQQGKRERANLSRLGNEIRLADWENHTLGFHSVEVEISRHDNEGRREGCTIPSHVVATISKTHCDLAEIQKLLREALTSKRTIAQITRELADIEALL